jgi:FixJ family two-component response regulator
LIQVNAVWKSLAERYRVSLVAQCLDRIEVITGRGDPAARARAEQLGALAFLDKPVSSETLLANTNKPWGKLDLPG